MWKVKITILNMKTLQEYRIHHDRMMEDTDIVITYNAHIAISMLWIRNSSASEHPSERPTVIAYKSLTTI